jgi:hypothetical protein
MTPLSFLIGAAGFVVYALLFMVLLRTRLREGWFLLELGLGAMIHVLTSIMGAVWITGFSYWYNLSSYTFLWFCFFFVSSIYNVSVTLGIIRYLYHKSDHSASMGDIYQYCILEPFRERAGFFVSNGQAQQTQQGL